MGPINYSLGGPDPSQMLLQGLGTGLQINQMQQARAQAEAQAQAQQRMNAELEAASRDPRMIPGLMVRYPEFAKNLQIGLDSMTADQRRGALANNTEVAAALASNKPEFAVQMVERRAELLREQGDNKGADTLRQMAADIKADPDAMLSLTLGRISQFDGGDKVAKGILDIFGERRAAAKAPAELRTANAGASKAEADAATTAVTAKYAESKVTQEIQAKGWEIQKLMADTELAKENRRIAAITAQLALKKDAREEADLKLRRDEAVKVRDDKLREKVANAEAGASNIDNMLNTIERIKKNPSLNDVIGSLEGALPGMVTSGLDDEESDAIRLIETLGSQAFLAQLPNIKGMGQLSNAEGEKLQSALQNLGRAQSEKQFRANLDEAARLLTKGRDNLAKSTGIPLSKPDTPAAPGARPPLSSFYNQ